MNKSIFLIALLIIYCQSTLAWTCYQDYANSSICGNNSGSYALDPYYFYANFSLFSSTIIPIVQVHYGSHEINVTLNMSGIQPNTNLSNCRNNNPIKYQFRIYSHCSPGAGQLSYPQCYDGSNWLNIGIKSELFPDTCNTVGSIACTNQLYDGNFSTYCAYFVTAPAGWYADDAAPNSKVYELGLYLNRSDYVYNSQLFNETTYETKSETYSLNVSYFSEYYSQITASLNYNGIFRSQVSPTLNGDEAIFSDTLDTPLNNSVINRTIYWRVYLTNSTSTIYYDTPNSSQIANPIQFNICNSTLNNVYLNFSFKDEADNTQINATIPYSLFEYYLGSGTVKKSLNLIEETENYSYAFCYSPSYQSINLGYYLQYSKTGYVQRILNPSDTLFTNNTYNLTLYLLSSSVGIYTTFQVVNPANQPLDNVYITIYKVLDNSFIGSGTTGSDGSVTFWINPNYQYNFTFDKTGYDLYSMSTAPTQSNYIVTLGTISSTNITDYNLGITTIIHPTGYLKNDTVYNFNYTLSSTYYLLDSFGFNITNSSGYLLGQTSSSLDTGGFLSINLDTVKNKTFILNYYYIINDTMIYKSISYTIYDDSYSEYSIKHFLDDFDNYLSTGIYGLTIDGTGLLVFLIIFVLSGVLTYKFGLTSPAAIMGYIFGLVALFDIGFGLLSVPSSIGAIQHFPTILTAIFFISILVREVTR